MHVGRSVRDVLLFLKIESSYLSWPPSLPPQLRKAWHSVGGLIDGSQGTGSPISGLAKRLSSATYQPYKHPPESTLLQRGEGRERITGVAGRQKWALRTEGGKWEIEGGRRMLKEQRGGSTAFSLAICFILVFILMVWVFLVTFKTFAVTLRNTSWFELKDSLS